MVPLAGSITLSVSGRVFKSGILSGEGVHELTIDFIMNGFVLISMYSFMWCA